MRLWDLSSGRLVADWGVIGGRAQAAFRPGGRALAVIAGQGAVLYALGGQDVQAPLALHAGANGDSARAGFLIQGVDSLRPKWTAWRGTRTASTRLAVIAARFLASSRTLWQSSSHTFDGGGHSSSPMTRTRIEGTLYTCGIPAIGRTVVIPSAPVPTLFRLVPTIFLSRDCYRGD